MKLKLLFALTLLGVVGCGTTPQVLVSPEEDRYIKKAMVDATDFTTPVRMREEVWGRAQAFIGRFRAIKIQSLSDFVIQASVPNAEPLPSLSLTQSPKGDSSYFTVQTLQTIDTAASERLEHVLSYYMFYGDEPPPKLIPRLETEALGIGPDGSPSSTFVTLFLVLFGIVILGYLVAGVSNAGF